MSKETRAIRATIDPMDPARADAFCATLGLNPQARLSGNVLPPFWHYLYFWDAQPPDNLGRDGHPKTGGFIPDMGLPRRMWAGGALEFLHPLKLGHEARQKSRISSARRKTGRSGDLAIVEVQHELWQSGQLCLRERQDLIYRSDPDPKVEPPEPLIARKDAEVSRSVSFNPTLLFRYSALTFNGHRIHYDRDYCREVEGYPGLVVHGPLLAQLLIHLAEESLGTLKEFSFRATAPLFDFETATLALARTETGLSLWVSGPDGRQCMLAEAS